jgi:hypothetical protein
MKRFGLIILPVFAQSFLLMLPVQATHKEINGCGDDSGLGRFVPNQPVGVDFRPVCDNHDECYGTLGESREHCDNVFRSALRAKCEKTLLRSAGGIFGTVVTGGQALTSCYGVAEAYYRSVIECGGTAYSKAQTHAREESASAPPNGNIQEGNFHHNGSVYYSNGQGAYCGFTSPDHYKKKSGRRWGDWLEINEPVPFQTFMRYDGSC